MRFLLPLLLLGALLAAYFLLPEPSETPDTGTVAEVDEEGTSTDPNVVAPAPALTADGQDRTEGTTTLQRSSLEDAAVVVFVRTADGDPAPTFTLYVAERGGETHKLQGEEGSLGLADVRKVRGFTAYAEGFWTPYQKLEDSPEPGEQKQFALDLSDAAATWQIKVQADDGLAQSTPTLDLGIWGSDHRIRSFLQGTFGEIRSLDQGSYTITLEQAPPGRYAGTVLMDEYVDITRRVELEAGQVEELELTLLAAGQVHGVVRADGAPLEDAQVALLAAEEQENPFGFSLDAFRSHGLIPDAVPEFQRTTTDSEGKFALPKNAPGKYTLLVASARHLPGIFALEQEVLPRRDVDLGSFDLDLGFGLDLVVRDPSGQALPKVQVQWARHTNNSLIGLARDGRGDDFEAAVTDPDGHAFLGGLPAERLQLTLEHEDFARLVEEYDFSGRTDPTNDLLEITMDPGASVSGQVVDGRTGTPIEGAELALQETETREEFLSMFGEDLWEATSAEDGGFRFTRLPQGEYVLVAKHADFSETTHGPFQVEDVAVEDLMVMLHPGATLHVEVLDDEGFPIEGATVQVVNLEGKINENATTDLNGMATLPPLAAGNYQVAHTNLGAFDTEENSGSVDVQVKFLKLEDYDEKTVTLGGLIKKADISGEVRRGGEFMPGATVAIITDSGVKAGVADKEGQYEILGVPLGTYTIIVTAGVPLRGGSTTYDSIHIAQEGAMRHDVLLSETGVEIHITAAGSGKNLPNVPVAVRPLDGTNIQGGNFGLTDDQGLLQISSLAPGSYIISAGNLSAVFLSTGDAGLGSKQISPVEIRETSGIQRFEVALEEGATFRVRVRDSTGNLLKGAHLHYLDENGQPMNILSMKGTNSKGVAQLEGLPSGPGIIKVRHTSLGVTEIPVNLRAGELQKKEVSLEAGTRVYVTPVDDNGAPLAGVLVTALDDRGAPASFLWSQEETQATNAAFFSGSAQKVGPLAPGDYQIQLYRPGKPPVRHPLTVDGGEEMHLQLPYSTDEG